MLLELVAETSPRSRSATGPQSFRVSWRQLGEIRLWRIVLFSWQLLHKGLFHKHFREEVIMSITAERLAVRLEGLSEIEEMAVFVEEETDPILAVRVAGQWVGVYRWMRHANILSLGKVEAKRGPQRLE